MESSQIADELNVGRASHEGMSGKSNEDAFAVLSWKLDDERNLHMGIVADGVGGQIAGEVASRLAVQAVKAYFDSLDQISNISGHLEQAILTANEAVYQASRETPAYRGMSTTIAIAAVVDGLLYTAHVGDSRIYLLRDGRFRQISTDHTWAQEAIEAGLLTPEQAKTHPNRNVIRRHLGGSLQVEVDHRLVLQPGQPAEEAHANQGMALRAGDTLLICSDGLTDMVDDQSILESLSTHYFKLSTAAQELVDKANRAGGKDNITLVLLQVPPKEAPVGVMPASATAPSVAAPAAGRAGRWRLPLILAGGGLIALVLAVTAGALFLFGQSSDEEATPSSTTAPVVAPGTPEATVSLEPGATAAILATSSNGTETPTPVDTPVLIPTKRDTSTPTATRRPPPSPTPTAVDTATSVPIIVPPPGPPGPQPPSATPQPPPSNTPQPPPSNTPEPPPTNTPGPPVDTFCDSCTEKLAALSLGELF